jgi:hypothetical protein
MLRLFRFESWDRAVRYGVDVHGTHIGVLERVGS